MDWLPDFLNKFGDDADLSDLKNRNFYGSLQLNFSNGAVTNCDIKQHKVCVVTVSSTTSTVTAYTLTQEKMLVEK